MREPAGTSPAFRRLRSTLVRRRLAQLDPRLRIELAAIAAMLGAFVFWHVRIPLAGIAHAGGPGATLGALAAAWAALALLTLVLVAFRHARRLRRGPPGPPWLALPIEPRRLSAHLGWDSSDLAAWMAPAAVAIWLAAVGLAPVVVLLALIVPFAAILVLAQRAGARLGEALATWGVRPAPGHAAIERILWRASPGSRPRSLPRARWSRVRPWLALSLKDLRVTRRSPAVARALLIALALWILSLSAWSMPRPTPEDRLDYVAAFVLALLGSAMLGEWLVELAGSDPFATLRVLPLGLSSVWGSRFAWAPAGAAALFAGHALLARDLAPHALRLFLLWSATATLVIAALAVNYGVTLFPRADLARRMFWLSLGLAVVASLMIPLVGWIVLASAVLHSTRRLASWSRLEEI